MTEHREFVNKITYRAPHNPAGNTSPLFRQDTRVCLTTLSIVIDTTLAMFGGTKKDLAERIGVDPHWFNSIPLGRKKLTNKTADKFIAFFGTQILKR